MDLLTLLFKLPFLPLRGVVWIGEVIRDETDRQLRNPMRIRHELEEAEAEARAGELSEEEEAERAAKAVQPMTGSPAGTARAGEEG